MKDKESVLGKDGICCKKYNIWGARETVVKITTFGCEIYNVLHFLREVRWYHPLGL